MSFRRQIRLYSMLAVVWIVMCGFDIVTHSWKLFAVHLLCLLASIWTEYDERNITTLVRRAIYFRKPTLSFWFNYYDVGDFAAGAQRVRSSIRDTEDTDWSPTARALLQWFYTIDGVCHAEITNVRGTPRATLWFSKPKYAVAFRLQHSDEVGFGFNSKADAQ